MIKKDVVTLIEQTLHLEAGTLQGALDNKEEVEITIPEIVSLKKADFETRLKNEKDAEYKKGKIAGEEMLIKDAREKFGLSFEGKSMDNFVEAFQKKILDDAKITPDEKIKEKDKTIKQLRDNIARIESDKQLLASQFEMEKKTISINNAIFSAIPDKAVTDKFGRTDILALFNANGYAVDIEEGKHIVKKNGEVIKDATTLVPLDLNKVVSDFVTSKGLLQTSGGGRGEGDGGGGNLKAGTIEAFEKEMDEKGVKYGTQEYTDEMGKRLKEGTLKI